MPKQFLPLVGERSTYQEALIRVARADLFAPPIVVTADAFRFFARRQAQDLGVDATIVLEPARRDSGPAIAAGAALALRRDPEAIVLALAADHVILDKDLFHAACVTARDAATSGRIVTFGIKPTSPSTSYGYIRPGEVLSPDGVSAVAAFVEKPDAVTAASYIDEGYLWNSGNFMFPADLLLGELSRYEPGITQAVGKAVAAAKTDLGFVRLDPEAFLACPAKSIDYALMERTKATAVVEARFRWSDIGSWDGVLAVAAQDRNGNSLQGTVFASDSHGCVVHSADRLTAILGVRDLVVVTTPDAVLVLPRDRAQEVKSLVASLKEAKRSEATDHRRGYRPWGYYDSVDAGPRFQVKRIVVDPGGKLSLQKHMHRSEHWVVVQGTAEVTCDSDVRLIHENESIYLPVGCVHRLANPGKIRLELIEVQTGSYLGEDDIIRLEDVYRRDDPDQ